MTDFGGLRDMYLELLKKSLTGMIAESPPLDVPWLAPGRSYDPAARALGTDWPSVGETMIGYNRLDSLQGCVEVVLADSVPGDLMECLPGDTLVSVPAGRPVRAMRRSYTGPLIKIATASGNQLSATPNHPVLTHHGYLRADLLQEGDYVIRRSRLERMGLGDPHVDNVPAPIGDVFHALEHRGNQRRPLLAMDLDVSLRGNEVEVIAAQGNLAESRVIARREPFSQQPFAGADLNLATLPGRGFGRERGLTPPAPALRGRPAGERFPESRISLHAEGHGLARRAHGVAGTAHRSVDRGLVLSVLPGQGVSGVSREVADDRVMSVRSVPYSGHVFNLQTTTGQYLANNIIVHNCGVWRGGACILMKALLEVHGQHLRRKVWVADSFQGLHRHAEGHDALAVPMADVQRNFRKYGLLDDQVRFIPGWFHESLPGPVEELAVLRLDGDQYVAQMAVLEHMYPRLSPGGFAIIDDYPGIPETFQAVTDYRAREGITTEIRQAGAAAMWRKP